MRGIVNVFPISVVHIIEGFIPQLSEKISLEFRLSCSEKVLTSATLKERVRRVHM